MTKADNIQKHLEDIDFRKHAERQKAWKADFLDWHKELKRAIKVHGYSDVLQGQLTMLSSVLWYLLPPKEYKALVRGRVFIDRDALNEDQNMLYMSLQAFAGSPYCDLTDYGTVLDSYIRRMDLKNKHHLIRLVHNYQVLANKIANNIIADAELQP